MKFTILPDNLTGEAVPGETILDAVKRMGVNLISSCGGAGTCGKCRVELVAGQVGALGSALPVETKEILSCQRVFEKDDVVIRIPKDGRRLTAHRVLIDEVNIKNPYLLNPSFKKIALELPEPDLEYNIDDLSRLLVELKKTAGYENVRMNLELMQKLPEVLREGKWKITLGLQQTDLNNGSLDALYEITSLESGHDTVCYGVAIDVGTTTVKANLVDLSAGDTIASAGEYNLQQRYGDDVINRIIYSEEEGGRDKLRDSALESINNLICKMINASKIPFEKINMAVIDGNTTMIHLLMGIPAGHIRLEPYVPAVGLPFAVKGKEIGLKMNPGGYVYTLPSVGSYVGGDITSGVLSTGLNKREEVSLLIDIGTNGEMVLGNQDWLISCACSAGPCFEGGGISGGMRAMDGAIDGITIEPDQTVRISTINNKSPLGICGSGLINIAAVMMKNDIIDRTGHFNKGINSPRIKEVEEGWAFVLVPGEESDTGSDILVLESDIQNLIRAKAAIYAGARVLLNYVGIGLDDISEILIAGGFGNSLNIKDAVTIGMLPDLPIEKYRYVGNSALKGAQMALTSQDALQEVIRLSQGMTYLDLSVGNDFMDEFMSAMFLPHTDFTQFPSVT